MSEMPTALTAEAAVAGAVASLAELVAALTAASDEQSMLAATMIYVSRFHPREARLFYLQLDAQGAPRNAQTVALWQNGQLVKEGEELTALRPLEGDPLLEQVLEKPQEQLIIGQTGTDGDAPSFALLQLRGEGVSTWQGLLSLKFDATHNFTMEERSAYRLLSFGLAMYLSGLSSQRALGAAMEEAALLHDVTKQLNVALSLDEVLRALLQGAPFRDEAEISLCSIENDAAGKPEWIKVIGAYSASGTLLLTNLNARYHVPEIPFAKLYLSSPDAPIVIPDIESDPRVDEYAKQLYAAAKVKSTIIMALSLQGRWVGLFNVSWLRSVPIGAREKRIYQGLAKQAALLLDNSLMLDRLRASLKETQQQGALMQRILDHLPVGIALLDGPTSRPVLGNACLDRLLGRKLDKNLGGTPALAAYQLLEPGTDRVVKLEDMPSRRAIASLKLETMELDVVHPDGERLSAEVSAVPIVDESGAVSHVIILLSDLTVRKRAEHERNKLQEEIIRVQAAALAERSSPLIPITDEILVLPLIGSIDTERGHQVLDTVLQGTSQRGARVAIIDITGVRTVDTQAAQTLTNAAQALRLLGVVPVLTGIRPEVAQTLVGLGVRLEGIVTRSTLQSGIQYALKHLNKRDIS